MANFTPVGPASPSTVSVQSKSTFTIANYTIVAANTEESFTIPIGAKAFRIRTEQDDRLLISHTSGGTASAATRFNIFPGEVWEEDSLVGDSAIAVYVQARKVGTVIQVLYWT